MVEKKASNAINEEKVEETSSYLDQRKVAMVETAFLTCLNLMVEESPSFLILLYFKDLGQMYQFTRSISPLLVFLFLIILPFSTLLLS